MFICSYPCFFHSVSHRLSFPLLETSFFLSSFIPCLNCGYDHTSLPVVDFRFRCRVLWFIVVGVAIGLWVTQVGLRTQVFLQHKSNVDVKVVYPEDGRLQFPSVTICNQNNYRRVRWTEGGTLRRNEVVGRLKVVSHELGLWFPVCGGIACNQSNRE